MPEESLSRLRQMAAALARELSNTPALDNRTFKVAELLSGEVFEIRADGLDDLTFTIERNRTHGRYSLGVLLPETLWKYEPANKVNPSITIAADREPASAARYVISKLITPALSYLEETKRRKDATESAQRERAASATRLIEASRGLISLRGGQSHANAWRNTVAVVATVFDGEGLGIEGQVDRETADLNFSKLTIEEAEIMLRVLSAFREAKARAAAQGAEDAGEADDGGDWLAAIAA